MRGRRYPSMSGSKFGAKQFSGALRDNADTVSQAAREEYAVAVRIENFYFSSAIGTVPFEFIDPGPAMYVV